MKAKPEHIKNPKVHMIKCVNYVYCRNLVNPNFDMCPDCKKDKRKRQGGEIGKR